jgi:beta-N-acetylhexosaminidase
MERRPPAETLLRRLRSHLPTSPLPWHWHERINRGVLAAVAVLLVGGAVVSVLLQGGSSSEKRAAAKLEAPPQVRRMLDRMSVQAKVDQLIAAGFDDPAAARAELASTPLGGVVVRPDVWPGGAQGRAMVSELRSAAASGGGVPPLVIAEQEGGSYRALGDLPPAQTEQQIGDTADTARAESWALQTGRALKAAGFDLNLAPVADVASAAGPIADRAFGDDPSAVAAMTAAAVRGCRASGIACAVSHFPGLGGASGDTDTGPATVSLDAAALDARDLAPFRAAFAAHVPAVVLSLAFYAAYDPVTPGALSPRVADELLRSKLHFDGVAITDDLAAGAISAGIGAPQAAVEAVAAGADMTVIGDPAQADQARGALLAAARSGQIPKDRLDQAVARVLTLKLRLGLLSSQG